MIGLDSGVLQALLTVTVLLAGAMCGQILCRRAGVAPVVGELIAGILLAPSLIGGLVVAGMTLVVLDIGTIMLAEAGILLLLFLVGLELSFVEFTRVWPLSIVVATCGAALPLVLVYGLCYLWGVDRAPTLLIITAAAATSTSTVFRMSRDLNICDTPEGSVLLSSAYLTDVLSLIILAVTMDVVAGSPSGAAGSIAIAVKSVLLWMALLIAGIFLFARAVDVLAPVLKKYRVVRLLPFTTCFGFSWISGLAGLMFVPGAFIAGLSLGETRVGKAIIGTAGAVSLVLTPLFFAMTGARLCPACLSADSLAFSAMLVLVAATGKVLGCGLPVLAVRRSPLEALVVGIGMLPRVDICLFIATTGLVSGLFSEYYYSALIILSLATVLTGPIAVKATYCLLEKRCRLGPDTWPGVEK